ncbi:MAG: hypothetical protein ACD_3C00165G0007 [uncultured bacterium (gcode 4)]|uniref:Uncharacterized protein n=1 Tax=uncultured bacterium (gcode 4) TaxID=1234023 RepID=K2FXM9_9BACT|nr:MAG: hypothetical protein ACD_3C00165G0007 [uncultured bacterium (gcode 4)]
MSSVSDNEVKVETKVCRCWVHFDITDKDLEFYDKVSPVFAWVKYQISTPALCPKCREIRRMSFKNDRKLYKSTCSATWKEIISIFSPDKPYKIYNQKDWWSDNWNWKDYWFDFDFSKSFFEQFQNLVVNVPRIALMNYNSENSEYWNYAWGNKNCYLVVGGSWENENCSYGTNFMKSADCMDCFWARECVNSYEVYWSNKMYDSSYCLNSSNSRNCHFSINIDWCDNCIFCTDLINKSYHIYNKPVSKQEFEDMKNEFIAHSDLERNKKIFHDMLSSEAEKWKIMIHSSEDVEWNYILDSKNLHHSFLINKVENGKYVFFANYCSNVMDSTNAWLEYPEYLYETINCWKWGYRISFCQWAWNNNKDIFYCDTISACNDCFWCTWLKNQQYCILNKQYTKEEYEILVPKIIEHMKSSWEWWEYFPSSISPFGYNETVAMEYYPMDGRDALQCVSTDGRAIFKWSDYENPMPNVVKIIPASKLPENITEIPDDIINWAIESEISKKPYRIIKQELDYYRKHSLPIPRKHPDERHQDRVEILLAFKSF